MLKIATILLISLLAVGCSSIQKNDTTGESDTEITKADSQLSDTAMVKANAQLAIQQCGKGNVKKVSTSGFSCRK
tara:strand:+ start:595 stop:819 length:225 start_codon:yes stop_codon:yes gene_type:complete